MSSQGRKKSTNPKCAKVGCITKPCIHKRPPVTEGGHCVDFNNGKVRSGIPQESADERAKKILETILSYKNCTSCGKEFKKGDGRFPYPEKQVLCKDCFDSSLSSGLLRLNKVLNER